MNKKVLLILLLIVSSFILGQNSNRIPERIILNLTTEPSSSIAVTWRTNKEIKNPVVQFSESTQWISFKQNVKEVSADVEKYVTDKSQEVFHYSTIIKNLTPNTMYVYRVGGDSVWSEWNQFTTADSKNSPFKFVYLGDPQNDIKEDCSRVFRETFKRAPDAKFWLIGGDLVSDPYDELWGEFFYAAGFIFRVTPLIAASGNHDHLVLDSDGNVKKSKVIASTWLRHLTLPENGPSEFKESTYYIDYQGVRFIIINSNDKIEEQSKWLDKILSNNPNKWTIVCFHHPIYSATSERDDRRTRDFLPPLFDKYSVDLVLTGHDHTYSRSKKIFNGKPVGDNEKGTVYVVSVSGPKAYPLGNKYNDLMVKTGENVQLYQVIEVNENKINYKSYTVNGQLYDLFELMK